MRLIKKISQDNRFIKAGLITLVTLTVAVGCGKDKGSDFEGHWKDKDGGSYLSVKFEDKQIKTDLLFFDSWSREFKKESLPAKIDGGSMYIQAGFENVPVIFDSDKDTLTLQGRDVYERFDGDPEADSVKWLEERAVIRAERKEKCKTLNAEIKEWKKTGEAERTETVDEIRTRTKAESPPGCILNIFIGY